MNETSLFRSLWQRNVEIPYPDLRLSMSQSLSNLKPGQAAPSFSASDANGETVRLVDYRGKRVVLYFYPKDDTPGCTVESCGLRDNYDKIRELGAEVLGVSVDDVTSHRKFTDKFNLPFRLVADVDKKISRAYGVLNEERGMDRRVTFLIDGQGRIERIFDPVKADQHPAEVVAALAKP